MLYLIGGPPRMGKSTLADKILEHHHVSGVSTDGLTVMLGAEGVPDFYSRHKAEAFYPYFKKFVERTMEAEPDYVIEGDAFMPRHVAEIALKQPLKCVFLGMSQITPENIIRYQHFDKWASQDSRRELENLAGRIQKASAYIESECLRFKFEYVDLAAAPYRAGFERAYKFLTK